MTTYTDPFTGQTIAPSQVSYTAIALATNETLQWPINGDNSPTSANIIEVSAASPGLNLALPPATQVSLGQSILITNVGANSFDVTDNAGGAIVTVASGIAWYVYVTDNATAAGAWNTVQFGAGTSAANAATLAGAGLMADGLTLNQAYATTYLNSSQTLVPAQRAQVLVWNSGVGTLTLPNATSVGGTWFCMIRNGGTGILTVAAAGTDTINGVTNVQLQLGDSFLVCSNGSTGFNTIGLGRSTLFAYTQLTLPVTGGTLTLTSAQAASAIQEYTGTLASAQTVVLPSTVQLYYVTNLTTGGYALTFKTAAVGGATFTLPQTNSAILICDGTNVLNASTVAIGSVSSITLANGALAAPSLNFASSSNTGLYESVTGQLAVAANGTQAVLFTDTQVQFPAGIAGGTF